MGTSVGFDLGENSRVSFSNEFLRYESEGTKHMTELVTNVMVPIPHKWFKKKESVFTTTLSLLLTIKNFNSAVLFPDLRTLNCLISV